MREKNMCGIEDGEGNDDSCNAFPLLATRKYSVGAPYLFS